MLCLRRSNSNRCSGVHVKSEVRMKDKINVYKIVLREVSLDPSGTIYEFATETGRMQYVRILWLCNVLSMGLVVIGSTTR